MATDAAQAAELTTLEFLELVWGEEDCYVDLPSKAGGHWIPFNIGWPEDRVLVRRRVLSCIEDGEDIYFSVARFNSRGRRLADVLPTTWLWADLDRVDPVFLEEDYLLPTLAWESSPDRYQCLWALSRPLTPATQTKLNQRLSYALTADKGGWDLTQVLRPIGTKNFKYDPVADVTLLWYDPELIYEPSEVRDAVWRIEEEEATADGTSTRRASPTSISRTDAKIPARARRLIATPPEMVVVGERSGKLWELERLLADAGFGEEEIFDLVWPTAWNKHREVRTGEERLRKEIQKALGQKSVRRKVEPGTDRVGAVQGERTRDEEEFDTAPERPGRRRAVSPFVDYATFLATNIETPRWLIDGIWSSSSHGIIGGEPKVGKSLFTMAMALSVATGRPFLGKYEVATPGPALIVQEENAPWMMQDRLRKLAKFYGLLPEESIEVSEAPEGAVADHVVRLAFPEEHPLWLLNNFGFDMTDEDDRRMLEDEIQRTGAQLVIIDPLYLVLPGVNLNNSHEVGPYLQWLMAVRHNYDCGIALVHHWTKQNENTKMRRAGQRLLGTAFFHGWLESGLYMEKLTEESGEFRVKVEREFRGAAPQGDMEVAWQPGEPGELDLNVVVNSWDDEQQLRQAIEHLLKGCDDRGLNLKHVAAHVYQTHQPTPEEKLLLAREVKALGYKVHRKKYPKGYGYIIFPEENGSG